MSVPSIKMMVRLVHPRNYHDEKRLDTVLPPSPHTHAVSAIPSYLQTVGLILLYYLGKVTKKQCATNLLQLCCCDLHMLTAT